MQGKNDNSELFYDTWNCLEATIASSELSIFALHPKTITWNFTFTYGTMLGSENSELSFFCTLLKTITQNFSKPTKAFNLENIVQACLVSFQTQRVNKYFSNSAEDQTF